MEEIEVIKSDIELIEQDYINTLPDKDNIYKVACFNGLLLAVYNNYLKYYIDKYKTDKNTLYKAMDNVFYNLYLPLCNKYCITPTITQFCFFCSVSNTHLSELKTGYNNGSVQRENITSGTAELIEKWYTVTENFLLGNTIERNSIGSIFVLKSKYGYREQDNKDINITVNPSTQNNAEIRQRYLDYNKPDCIDITDNI